MLSKDAQKQLAWTSLSLQTHCIDLPVNITFTCECTPEVLSDPLGVAEFGGDPKDSVRGGLDFEYVRSDKDVGCLSTQGDGDVTLLFSEDCRTLGL